jgi:hypothetical protein
MPCEASAGSFALPRAGRVGDHQTRPPGRRPVAARQKLPLNTSRSGVIHPDPRFARVLSAFGQDRPYHRTAKFAQTGLMPCAHRHGQDVPDDKYAHH